MNAVGKVLVVLLGVVALTACEPKATVSTPKIETLNKLLKKDPANARYWMERGFAYAMLGERECAMADLDRALELAPGDPSIGFSYGWALLNLDRPHDALKRWEDAVALVKERPWWVPHALAVGNWAAGNKSEALRQFDIAVKTSPDEFEEWNDLQRYTSFWTWKEKQLIYQIHDAWRRGYLDERKGQLEP